MRFTLLGSGSSGNAILVSSANSKLLIDSGLSYKQLRLRAEAVGETLDGLQGVFVTHEHRDHILGLGTAARRLGVPVFGTSGTLTAAEAVVGPLPRVETFEAGETISVDGLSVTSFSVCHDASDPVSYVIDGDKAKLGIASDLGRPSALVRSRLRDSHALVLESNYCPDMLRRGPYPPALQQRINGSYGHMSNAVMNSLLAELLHDRLQHVVLVHISEENNRHELALKMARQVLGNHPAHLHAAIQDAPSPVFEVHP